MPKRNITGRNTRTNGTKLNAGLDTMSDFNLVTAVENRELSHNVRMRFNTSASLPNDYMSDYSHISQFKINAGSVIVDGNSYANKWVATSAQFIAPYDCFLKSVDGYLTPNSGSGCDEQSLYISIWMKDVDVGGTSTTPVKQLFTQEFPIPASPSNNLALQIDGTTDSRVNNSSEDYKITAQKAVIVSVRRSVEDACGYFNASFNMVFQAKDTHYTSEDFKFQTISVANHRYDNTISNPDRFYIPTSETPSAK